MVVQSFCCDTSFPAWPHEVPAPWPSADPEHCLVQTALISLVASGAPNNLESSQAHTEDSLLEL